MTTFKVGDNVRISEKSNFFKHQGRHGEGKITKIKPHSHLVNIVVFKNGYQNSYGNKDLIMLEINWKEVLEK